MRYSAFISYSSRDRDVAAWLHRALEGYRIPAKLRGRDSPVGIIAARLPPVFRDREEFAAAANLGDAIDAALRESATLIVLCSPSAAASRWVNAEIRSYIALGRRARIRCLILDGAHGSAASIPPALTEGGAPSPLSADLRAGQDGRLDAKLKLIAGILDVPFDDLKQRDSRRRIRVLATIALASTIGFVVAAALAVTAFVMRAEATRQRDLARQRTLTAERTVEFVKSMFRVSDPSEARGASITAREVLDRGVRDIGRGLVDEPAVRAELGTTLAEVYGSLGLTRQSDNLVRWTFGIRHDQPAVRAMQYLVLGETQQAAGDYRGALTTFDRALSAAETPGVGRSQLVPRILLGIGQTHTALQQYAQADAPLRRALALDLAASGPNHPDVARNLEGIGLNDYYAGRPAVARPIIRRALAIRLRAEGPMSPSVADNRNTLANIAREAGDLQSAERYFRANLAVDEKVLGPNHPDLAATLVNFARLLLEQRKFAEAQRLLRRAVAIQEAQKSPEYDDFAFSYSNLALTFAGEGRPREAEPWFVKALAVARATNHRNLAPVMTDLAGVWCRTGRTGQGIALLRDATPIMRARYPAEAWRAAWTANTLGECLVRAGKREEGRRMLTESAPTIMARWPGTTYYGYETQRRARL